MRTIDILGTLFMNDVHNPHAFVELLEDNKADMEGLNDILMERLGYKVNREVLSNIALHMLLSTHDPSEIIELLEYFHQLKNVGCDGDE